MEYRVQNTVNGEYLDDDDIFLLPNGEVGWFIRDGSYPHYRKFGHQEDFKVINEDCERLQKQLDIALKYFSLIKRNVSIGSLAYTYVENAKTEIKELENENS